MKIVRIKYKCDICCQNKETKNIRGVAFHGPSDEFHFVDPDEATQHVPGNCEQKEKHVCTNCINTIVALYTQNKLS